MNATNAAEYIPLVQALADGKTIQFKLTRDDKWVDSLNPSFDSFQPKNYRIKPTPREWTMLVPTSANTYNDLPHICRTTTAQSDKHWEKITVREII